MKWVRFAHSARWHIPAHSGTFRHILVHSGASSADHADPRDCSGRTAPCATPRGVAHHHASACVAQSRGFFRRRRKWVRFAHPRKTSTHVNCGKPGSTPVNREPTDNRTIHCAIRLSKNTSVARKTARLYYPLIVRDLDNNRARRRAFPPKNASKNSGFA